jgi:hypothetical protein
MISLLFKFFGDSTPLKKEAEKAKGEMKTLGGEIGQTFGSQFKSQIMATIGLGAIAAAVKSEIADIQKAAKEGTLAGRGTREELALSRAAAATGLSKEDILEQGKRDPEAFANLMKRHESPLSEGQLTDVSRSTTEGISVGKQVLDKVLQSAMPSLNQGIGAVKAGLSLLSGDKAGFYGSAAQAVTGVSSASLRAGPEESFLQSVRASRQSDAEFNAMVDEVNQRLEAIKEAVEKS